MLLGVNNMTIIFGSIKISILIFNIFLNEIYEFFSNNFRNNCANYTDNFLHAQTQYVSLIKNIL